MVAVAALAVDVGVRLGGQEEAAVGCERESVTRDLAIAGIGDARFNAIDQVLLLAVDLGRNRDLQLAVGIERAALLLFLIAAVGVAFVAVIGVVGHIAAFSLVAAVGLVVIVRASHRPVGRRVHHPFDLGIGDRLAEVVARVDGRLDRLALQHARRLRRDLHRVFRLLVLLNREVRALDIALAHLHD